MVLHRPVELAAFTRHVDYFRVAHDTAKGNPKRSRQPTQSLRNCSGSFQESVRARIWAPTLRNVVCHGLGSGQFQYRNLRAGAEPDRKASGADAAIDVELAAALFIPSTNVMCHQAAEVEAAMNAIERQLPAVNVPCQSLITSFAILMGAPFWFDLLNKVINLRISGDPPAPAH